MLKLQKRVWWHRIWFIHILSVDCCLISALLVWSREYTSTDHNMLENKLFSQLFLSQRKRKLKWMQINLKDLLTIQNRFLFLVCKFLQKVYCIQNLYRSLNIRKNLLTSLERNYVILRGKNAIICPMFIWQVCGFFHAIMFIFRMITSKLKWVFYHKLITTNIFMVFLLLKYKCKFPVIIKLNG